jgi:arylformamidase
MIMTFPFVAEQWRPLTHGISDAHTLRSDHVCVTFRSPRRAMLLFVGRGLVIVSALIVSTAALVACGEATEDASTTSTRATSTTTRAPERDECSAEVRRDVVYVERPGTPPSSTSLDVHPAPGACDDASTPIVLWVHGGGWSVGDKARLDGKLDLVRGLDAALVSVNYRLTPRRAGAHDDTADAPDDAPNGVQHPAHVEDVAAAVAWTTANAASFGGDPARITLVGHSAGGHLVALLGTDDAHLRAAGVPAGALDCVVALDTEGYDLTAKVDLGGASAALVRNAFGDDPAVWADASPITHVGGVPDARFLVVTRGTPRRQAEAARFAAAVNAAGGSAEVVRATGFSHADVNRRLGEPGEAVVTPPVERFLRSCMDGS